MKFRNTALVALVFAGLCAYLYLVEQPRQRQEEEAKKLLAFKIDDVTSVVLHYAEAPEIILKKTGAGWRLEKPVADAADEPTVTNLIRAVADAEVKRTLEGAGPPEGYGLDKPSAVVTLGLADGKTLPAVRVGNTAPVGFSTYVQLDGSNEVKLVSSAFHSGMKKEAKELRDKTVVDFKDDEVERVEVTSAEGGVELAREGIDWKIEKPAALKADATEVRTFLSSLRGLRAQDFVDEPGSLAEYGLDQPRKKIAVVVGKDKTRKEVWVGAEKEEDSKKNLYVKRADGGTVYAVGTWAWNSLNKDLSSFRDKTLLAFAPESLAAIEVTRRDGDSYRLVRKPGEVAATPGASTPSTVPTPATPQWSLEGAAPGTARNMALTQLVGDLQTLKGYEVAAEKPASLSAYSLDNPDVTFSLLDKDGKPIGRILAAKVGTGADATVFAMAEGSQLVFKVREYLYSHLDKKKADLVESAPAPAVAESPTPE